MPNESAWSALAPLLLLCLYFFGGLAVYWVRSLIRGAHRDADMESRATSVFAGMWIRLYFVWLMQPVWLLLTKLRIPANAVTTLSILLAAGSGVALAAGHFALGGWLYIASGICDFFDGRLARAQGRHSPAGGALDSILDRYSDAAIFIGLAWFYRESWVLLPVLFGLVGSSLTPYIRAKGEAMGVGELKSVGAMQRAERIIYLGVPVTLSPVLEAIWTPSPAAPAHVFAVLGIVLIAVSTQVTSFHRFIALLATLDPAEYQRPRLGGRAGIFRWATASGVATAADFAVMHALVSLDVFAPWWATALGAAAGGAINFTINRLWSFESNGKVAGEAGRYIVVSTTSAMINAGGVYVLLLLPGIDFRFVWLVVRGLVMAAWNYPLQRGYVFTVPAESNSEQPRVQTPA
jgi:phosphatidylglycerophosphate synthase